jgi:uncharacterized protein (DUF2384 family)
MERVQDQPTKSRTKRKVIKARPACKPTGADHATTAAGRPPNFQRLERFFVSQSALARALGVRRDTIRVWQEGQATRLRESSVARVNTVCAIAEEVAGYLPREKLVGEWLLAPHIGLGGVSPAAFIHSQPGAYQKVLRLIAREAQSVSVGDISDLPSIDELGLTLAGLPEPAPDPDADPDFLASLG